MSAPNTEATPAAETPAVEPTAAAASDAEPTAAATDAPAEAAAAAEAPVKEAPAEAPAAAEEKSSAPAGEASASSAPAADAPPAAASSEAPKSDAPPASASAAPPASSEAPAASSAPSSSAPSSAASSSAPAPAAAAAAAPVESGPTMQALILTNYGAPTEANEKSGVYKVGTHPRPAISQPEELLIRVHAASINPIDWKLAEGQLKVLRKEKFPTLLGYDVSGVVEAVGTAVNRFKVGDEVLSRVHHPYKGTFAEYVLSTDDCTTRKPKNLSHIEASCLPLAGMTALQSIRRTGVAEKPVPRSLFIPAALGGVGSLAIQLARHHFHIEKIATAVSTGKVDETKRRFDGPDLEVIDYKAAPVTKGREGTFDAVFDTTGEAAAYMPLLKQRAESDPVTASSHLVSIATTPNPDQAAALVHSPIPWLVRQVLTFKDWRMRKAAEKRRAQYEYLVLKENTADLQLLVDMAEAGQLKPIVGKVFPLTQAVAALRASKEGQVAGKVVIDCSPGNEAAAAAAAGASSDASGSSGSSSGGGSSSAAVSSASSAAPTAAAAEAPAAASSDQAASASAASSDAAEKKE